MFISTEGNLYLTKVWHFGFKTFPIWYQKNYKIQYQKNFGIEKKSDSVLRKIGIGFSIKKFGIKKSIGFSIKKRWYRKEKKMDSVSFGFWVSSHTVPLTSHPIHPSIHRLIAFGSSTTSYYIHLWWHFYLYWWMDQELMEWKQIGFCQKDNLPYILNNLLCVKQCFK